MKYNSKFNSRQRRRNGRDAASKSPVKGANSAERAVVQRSIVPTLVVNLKKIHTFRFVLSGNSTLLVTDTDLLRLVAVGAPTVALPNQLVSLFASVRFMRVRIYNLPSTSTDTTQASVEWSGSAGVDVPLEYKSTVDYSANAGYADLVPPKGHSNVGFWLHSGNIAGVNLFKLSDPVSNNSTIVDITMECETGDIDHTPSVFSSSSTATTVGVQYSLATSVITPIGFTPYIR